MGGEIGIWGTDAARGGRCIPAVSAELAPGSTQAVADVANRFGAGRHAFMSLRARMATVSRRVQSYVAVGAQQDFLVTAITSKRACIGPQRVRRCSSLTHTQSHVTVASLHSQSDTGTATNIKDALLLVLQPAISTSNIS